MNLKSRLKRLSPSLSQYKKVIVVKYPAELVKLSFGSERFDRQQAETADDFIIRAKELVLKREKTLNTIILVGNF